MPSSFSPLINAFEDAELLSTKQVAKRHDVLKPPGSLDTNIYCIWTGVLRVFVQDKDRDNTIRFGYEGSLITALDSFLTEKPSPLSIEALRKTEFSILKKSDFQELLKNNRELQSQWSSMHENLIVQQLEREIDLLTNSPAERLERVRSRSPQLFQEVPLKYIANYLRMTPETLSRLLNS